MEKGNGSKKRVFFISKKDQRIFEFLKSSMKRVETRAATVRNLLAQPGDTAVFICNKKRLEKRIKKVTHFKNIPSMLKQYKFSVINPAVKNTEELLGMYHQFPGYKEKIKQYGILAFELE